MTPRTETPKPRHLPMLLILASFSALFIVIGFIAGWELRWTEDVYDEKRNADAAERAAVLAAGMTEAHMISAIKAALCKDPGDAKK